jgi:DNA-binding response OmpR family regulator
MHIVFLDEDQSQRGLLLEALAAAGHACHAFGNAKALLTYLRRDPANMLILHCPLVGSAGSAGSAGMEVLRWVREHQPLLPVLVIASAAEPADILAGLAAGAHDYLIKPLRRTDLLARVEVQLRRAYPDHKPARHDQFGSYLFESQSARLTIAGKAVELTQKEFDLALFFFRHVGQPLSRATIQEVVWAREGKVDSRTIDTHVSRVRNKLGLRPGNGYRLAPVYSYGYQLEKTTD